MTHEPTGPTEAAGSFDGDRLTGALDVLAERIAVGPPPLDEVRRGAARRRRVRTGTVAAGLAAASVLGAVVLTATGRPAPGPVATDPAASGSPSPAASDAPAPPPGTRWVGSGHVAIAVPEDFPVNALPCPGPLVDSVWVDPGVIPLCGPPRTGPVTRIGVDSAEEPYFREPADRAVELGRGVVAQRWDARPNQDPRSRLCEGAVLSKEADVRFVVSSDEADACARVDALLDTITYLPGLVGVPGPGALIDRPRDEPQLAAYRRVLREAGLDVGSVVLCYCSDPVYTTDPAPGSMVPEGSQVALVLADRD